MSEKKLGFFGRLFKRKKKTDDAPPPDAATSAESTAPAEQQTSAPVPEANQPLFLDPALKSTEVKEQDQLEKERTAKETAEKAEQERLEQERTAKEAAEKAEQERLEQERSAKEAAEKAEQERLEQERTAKEAAEKAEQERLEQERTAKEAAEKAEQERLEQERSAKETADKAEKERLEQERTAKEAAEKEEQERLEQERLEQEQREKEQQEVEAAAAQEAATAKEATATETESAPVETKSSWLSRLTRGLSKSSNQLTSGLTGLFTKKKLDDEQLEALEDLLIQSDLGVDLAVDFCDKLAKSRYDKEITPDEIRTALAQEITQTLTPVAEPLSMKSEEGLEIILMIGVNGSGKTTTIGKLAQRFANEGLTPFLAAGDTFRAAAVDQLKIWAERTNAGFISGKDGADAAGLVYDAINQANEADADILLIDTAGRLQNKTELMAELEKIVRVIKKQDATAPHHILLVLDATTGQNALSQVELFNKSAPISGLIMTKLDGSARGGILVAIANKYKIPIHAIGVGETLEDLRPFEPEEFAKAITQT